jgi:hypothetical protein
MDAALQFAKDLSETSAGRVHKIVHLFYGRWGGADFPTRMGESLQRLIDFRPDEGQWQKSVYLWWNIEGFSIRQAEIGMGGEKLGIYCVQSSPV